MKFSSTAGKVRDVSAAEAVLTGLPADGGLFQPNTIPRLSEKFFADLPRLSLPELSLQILSPFFADEIATDEFLSIVESTFSFPAPLREVESNIWTLELFHGPTFAFKDFGARFLARLMSSFRKNASRELTILVATSGDTGSAVANGFYKLEGIRVVLLYPSGKVSRLQEQQLTTIGENCQALEISGSFDDCQKLVKTAFLDTEVRAKLDLSSANSINIGRLLPQACYYFSALAQLPTSNRKQILCSVPSGNFGNLCAGLLAQRMGLPISHFVAALNRNDAFARYLNDGQFQAQDTIETLSNAMDVGNPSNLERIKALFDGRIEHIRSEISAATFTDAATLAEMKRVFEKSGYILDPHGAVALLGLRSKIDGKQFRSGIFLETAHPAKFGETVFQAIGRHPELPPALEACLRMEKKSKKLPPNYRTFKEFLLAL